MTPIEQLLSRLRGLRLSGREQRLLVILGIAASIGAAIAMHDRAALARASADAAHLARVEAEERHLALSRSRFREQVAEDIAKVRDWSISEPTVYIAQLRAEGDVLALARRAGIANARAYADAGPAPVEGAMRPRVESMTLVLEGDFSGPALAEFLALAASARTAIRPLSIEVSESQLAPRLTLTAAIPYVAQEPAR